MSQQPTQAASIVALHQEQGATLAKVDDLRSVVSADAGSDGFSLPVNIHELADRNSVGLRCPFDVDVNLVPAFFPFERNTPAKTTVERGGSWLTHPLSLPMHSPEGMLMHVAEDVQEGFDAAPQVTAVSSSLKQSGNVLSELSGVIGGQKVDAVVRHFDAEKIAPTSLPNGKRNASVEQRTVHLATSSFLSSVANIGDDCCTAHLRNCAEIQLFSSPTMAESA